MSTISWGLVRMPDYNDKGRERTKLMYTPYQRSEAGGADKATTTAPLPVEKNKRLMRNRLEM